MKSIFLLFVSFLFAVNFHYAESKRMSLEDIKEALKPVKTICINKVSVDPKLVDDANNGKFATDRKLQCYYKCMMLMTKAMTKDDKIRSEQFVKIAENMLLEDLVDPMLKGYTHCQPIVNKPLEGCELAYEMAKCFYDYNPKFLFYP
ncbi:Obp2 [Eciton burchellii]|nr:Obp2 [Eciton burchellii]